MLRQAGADIVATDRPDPEQVSDQRWIDDIKPLTAVQAVRQYPGRTLFICWPTYREQWSNVALRAFNGSRVVYIGEGNGGCTGCEAFHDRLDSHWVQVATMAIPQWEGIHDHVMVFEREGREGRRRRAA